MTLKIFVEEKKYIKWINISLKTKRRQSKSTWSEEEKLVEEELLMSIMKVCVWVREKVFEERKRIGTEGLCNWTGMI